jgi:molybdopterin-guanine dinucleotide biosynthesis protein A
VADRLAATGILLVGGGSERFGSPKALARFRGESLAERGWRLLHEACEEVLAVGKEADGLDLAFPLVDDGSEERAPVYGVVAGLRAASHEVAVVLPVDCPLVTVEALRALADARAVPQTGPLPGAYAKSSLAELEQRTASGELSLRGVNATVVSLDERLLVNVNTRVDLIEAAISDWALERKDVHAAVVAGSRARADTPADRWSDLDVFLLVDDVEPYIADGAWVAEFGRPVLTFVEPTPVGVTRERRVLFETGEDVDLPLVPLSALDRIELARPVLARDYRVLVDKIDLASRLAAVAAVAARVEPAAAPGQRELTELTSDFWYHALWAARKLRRGEVYTAISCLDGYLKARVVTLLEWHARAIDPSVDTWHDGRFLERWADPGALSALERAYSHYDLRDVARALWETIDLFQSVEEETARRLGLTVELDHPDLRRRISDVVRDPRHASTL